MSTVTDTPVDRVLDLVAECFTPEVAARLASLKFDEALQAQLDELAGKANEGQLSDEERRNYLSYIELMDFVAILRLKAEKFKQGPVS